MRPEQNVRFQRFSQVLLYFIIRRCTMEQLIGKISMRNFSVLRSRYNLYYYLFKKFLVSDWLTANCEIVISTQWRTKSGFFTFILAK
jgi:hypothetical protein